MLIPTIDVVEITATISILYNQILCLFSSPWIYGTISIILFWIVFPLIGECKVMRIIAKYIDSKNNGVDEWVIVENKEEMLEYTIQRYFTEDETRAKKVFESFRDGTTKSAGVFKVGITFYDPTNYNIACKIINIPDGAIKKKIVK